jgi:hypothetical protein
MIEAQFGGGSACMANGSDFRNREPSGVLISYL